MERADARLSMRVEGTRDEGARAHLVTETQNISASGVYCRSSHYLAPLSKVDLTIVLPRLPGTRGAKELIKCEGIVVRCESASARKSDKTFELACMFSGLDERRKEMLDEFVTWRNLQALASAVNGRPARAAGLNGAAASKSRTKARAGAGPRRTRATIAKPRTRAAAPKRRTLH
jgi:hypothetical protein